VEWETYHRLTIADDIVSFILNYVMVPGGGIANGGSDGFRQIN